jgi:pyridoxamine 5'-phosphate oxidase
MSEPLHARPLRESDLGPDPLAAFARWYEEAGAAVRVPEAVALATAAADGTPAARMVLLKGFDERGFAFYSNTAGRKGRELSANPRAALLFHWDPLGRQVRVEGPVEPLDPVEAQAYFDSRPEGSRISALASRQSEPVASREELERRVELLRRELAGRPIPLPDDWGGWRLRPVSFEFWQNRDDRLHDRLRYRGDGGGWALERLQP